MALKIKDLCMYLLIFIIVTLFIVLLTQMAEYSRLLAIQKELPSLEREWEETQINREKLLEDFKKGLGRKVEDFMKRRFEENEKAVA